MLATQICATEEAEISSSLLHQFPQRFTSFFSAFKGSTPHIISSFTSILKGVAQASSRFGYL